MDINTLLTVKGKSGLWELVKLVPKANMARIQNIVSGELATLKIPDISSIKNYRIFLADGKELMLEYIFGCMSELEEKGQVFTPGTFESLSELQKDEFMELVIPGYDKLQFKAYHMLKIIKWYNDINIALDREADTLNALMEACGDVETETETNNDQTEK